MPGSRYQTNNKETEYFLTHTAVGSLDSRTQLLYQSKEFMSDFGFNLQDFDARLFDSQLGRWHAIDPVTQFASPYVGMGNNPVSLTDPDGRQVSHGGGGKLPKRNMRKKHLYDADDLSERGGYYYQPWDQIEIVDYYTFSVGSYNTGTFGSSIGSSGISHGSGGNGYGRAVHQSPDDLEYEISPPSDDPRPRITLTEQMQSAMLRSLNVISMGIENGSFSERERGNVATNGWVDGMDVANYIVSNSGTLAGGAQYGVNSMSNKQQWKYSYKANKYLKGKGVNIQTRAIKHGVNGVLKNASRKITYVGGVLAVADVAIDGELRASHLLNAGMVGVSAIPVAGWIIGGGYFVADMITLGVSGQSIGQHLDAAVGAPLLNDIYDW